MQRHFHLRVLMRKAHKFLIHPDVDVQLLGDFPGQALFQCFARLLFSPGKFPFPAKVVTLQPAADQDFAVISDDAGGNLVMGFCLILF